MVNKEETIKIKNDPVFLYNNFEKGIKLLSSLENEFFKCISFNISVAFITNSGVSLLRNTFKELSDKNIKGRIITTDYLSFSEPKAISDLNNFPNIEIRIYKTENNIGLHTKGYMFSNNDHSTFIVGSSNLTQSALAKTEEWNTKVTVNENNPFYISFTNEFERLWNKSACFNDYIHEYTKKYEENKLKRKFYIEEKSIKTLEANTMQRNFVSNLTSLINSNESRGLLVSATGTGKTYATAFALDSLKHKRVLFLVHREQIAKQALDSYKRILGSDRSFGLLSGNKKEVDCDYLFSTMQIMAKKEVHEYFLKDHFDYIIVDEAHKVGSKSYNKIINYFEPKFLLGMTATPERSDDFNVYELFDNNIIQNIRLSDALEHDLLCPFHYFGISEFIVENNDTDFSDFSKLVSDKRVDYIIEKAIDYGYSGEKVKGLIFCRKNEESIELSNKFNERGYKTKSLSGLNSQEERITAIELLEKGELDYIFTVDIFNEGIDIPEINQVIMLRPTQSLIVFIQQLGRGLRKSKSKEYVVILDFIGNYSNNFMIPIALLGDKTYDKDTLRKATSEGSSIIKGESTVSFDKISKNKIFESIEKVKLNTKKNLKDAYFNIKNMLSKTPTLVEFDRYSPISYIKLFDKNFDSYIDFLLKVDNNYVTSLSNSELLLLKFFSKETSSFIRLDEFFFIESLLEEGEFTYQTIKSKCENFNISMSELMFQSVVNILSTKYFETGNKNRYLNEDKNFRLFEESNGIFKISCYFKSALLNEEFKSNLLDLLEVKKSNYLLNYSNTYKDSRFVLNKKYSRTDVYKLIGLPKEANSQNVGGYLDDKISNTFNMFINYHKEEHLDNVINYQDAFIDESNIVISSKLGRTINSPDMIRLRDYEVNHTRVNLFVRKDKNDKDESTKFYYLGYIYPKRFTDNFIYKESKQRNEKVVEVECELETPVQINIFDYITKVVI